MEDEAKQLLLDTLDFYKYKLNENLCTPREIDSLAKMAAENLEIEGTADDFAQFFGKSKDAVWGIIKRNVSKKPRRNVVLYSFQEFLKKTPKSLRKKR